MLSVGPVGPVIITIRTITILGWLVAIFATLPIEHGIPDDVSRLAIGVAVVGSVKYLLRRSQKPATDVYEVGVQIGREQVLREQASADRVIRLEDRRQLRAAEAGERAVGGGRWSR